MAENKTIIESIVDQYNNLGLGVKDGMNSLVSESGVRVDLEPLWENDVNTGIVFFVDGLETHFVLYDNVMFAQEVNDLLASELDF